MGGIRARYDGLADWYDKEIRSGPATEVTAAATAAAVDLLGEGPGRCLDLGCGTGIALPAIEQSSWTVTGLDVSSDQLRVARSNLGGHGSPWLVQGDAETLPFADESFDVVVSVLTHTDLRDLMATFSEVVRVLRRGGRFVYVGTHPCFVNPFFARLPSGDHVLHPGYRQQGWTHEGPGFGDGIRPRVGVNHRTLEGLTHAFLSSGLQLQRLREPGVADPPILIALEGAKRGRAR